MRQRNLNNFGTRVLDPGNALFPQRINLDGHAIDAIFAGNSDLFAAQIARQPGFPLRHRQIERGRILGIKSRHRLEQDRTVADIARHRPRLIERRSKSDHAPARAAAIGRLDSRNADKACRLADRTASIGPRRARAQPRGDRGGRSARRPARRERRGVPATPPRRNHIAERAGFVRRAHRELVKVELAEHPRARAPELRRDGRFILRHKAFKNPACSGRLDTLRAE